MTVKTVVDCLPSQSGVITMWAYLKIACSNTQ